MDKNKRNTMLTVFGISVLVIALVGSTFAYFTAQQGGTSTQDVSVTSNTTDNLSFTIGNDITFTASEANFYQGGNNVSGSTSAQALLTPNNNTNQATMNYYMYLNLTSNPTVYSTGNTNEDAELVLQVFDGSNQLVTLTGLGSQVALGNGYGYDITGQEGLITLLNNHAITANGSATTENWSVVITLVNLNLDQNDNTNKTITGEIIMTKTAISPSGNTNNTNNNDYLYWNDDFEGNDYYLFESPDDVYPTIAALVTAYGASNFADNPIYIRSTEANGSITGHEVCFYHATTGKEFCLAPNYWVGDAQDEIDGSSTKDKLKDDMEAALGITIASGDCYSNSSYAGCYVGNFYCDAGTIYTVDCFSGVTDKFCYVDVDGLAGCHS